MKIKKRYNGLNIWLSDIEVNVEQSTNSKYNIVRIDDEYNVLFKTELVYPKKNAIIDVEIYPDGDIRVVSKTDGYHWLHYFLAQEPNCKEIIDYPHQEERNRVKQLFKSIGLDYRPEDKESCYLLGKEFTSELLIDILDIIEPRFANRHRFF